MRPVRSWSPAMVLGALAVVALLVWWPVARCGFVWDDDDYVTRNPVLRSWGGLWQIWFEPTSLPQYYPLVHTTFWLEYRLWGLHPLGFHVDNVVLHTLAAWLLWRLLRVLALPGALFAASWFLVHPVHVESVAWVTERKNVLSLVCALAAALQWLRWRDGGARAAWWRASAWFAAALLAKSVVATLPAVLLVVAWWRDGRITRRDVRGVLPWFAAGALSGAFTAWLEATHVGASGTPWQLAGAERLLVAGRAPWFYAGSLFWPLQTCFNHERWRLDAASPVQWAWPLATAAAVAIAWALRVRAGRGPLAVLLLYGGMLVPVLGFFDVYPFRYSWVADHFQYHASTVLLAAASAAAAPVARRLPRALAIGAPSALLAGCAALTMSTIPWYRDLDSLWHATLERNPASSLALGNLGGMANDRGELDRAQQLLESALALEPGSFEWMGDLGVVAHKRGDRAAARQWYDRALALRPDAPAVNNNLAVLHIEEGRLRDAIACAERAAAADPAYAEARITLGRALHDAGEWERALAPLDWVLQRLQDHVESRQRAVTCLLRLGRAKQAASNALVCVQQQPASATARQLAVDTMAEVLRGERPDAVQQVMASACSRYGVDAAALAPPVADALRRRGDAERADALLRR